VEELHDLGDVLLVRIRAAAQSAHGDARVLDRFWQAASWVDGKCIWWRNCSTEAEALEAAGLGDS